MTAVLVDPHVDTEAAVTVPCTSKDCPTPAAVVVVWTDPTPHARRIPLCDRHAGMLLDAFDSGTPPRCVLCHRDADVVEVRVLTP